MFTFFEAFDPVFWKGLEKRGLLNNNTGVRFNETLTLDEWRKFNNFASVGSELYKMQSEYRRPMYIDRLQGGVYYEGYPYDKNLLGAWEKLLGDKFWGFQMHELASNYRNDLRNLSKLENWTKESIVKKIRDDHPDIPEKYPCIEVGTPEEILKLGKPTSAEEYIKNVEKLFLLRSDKKLLPCDSFDIPYKMEFRLGYERIMPELGAQTPATRLQLSYARTLAKSYGRSFGAYYEPWGGDPFSGCNYHREKLNEWQLNNDIFTYKTHFNGGSSRALQKRIYHYSYLSGAQFISEEWGKCNTFYDWKDYELTPYGIVKKEFLDFTEKYPDIGEKLSPVAVVLPKDYELIDWVYEEEDFIDFPIAGKTLEKYVGIKKKIFEIFDDRYPVKAYENSIINAKGNKVPPPMINSPIPDAVALLHADDKDIDKYDYLIDLTYGDASVAKRKNLIKASELYGILDVSLPCNVAGKVHWMVNALSDGRFLLSIWNNDGIARSVEKGEYVIDGCEAKAEIVIKSERELKMLEGASSISRNDGKWLIEIPAGDWFFGIF